MKNKGALMSLSSTEPLKIALIGFHERDRAMLNLFFRMHCTTEWRIIDSEHEANLCMLDLDNIHGKKLLQDQRDQHPGRPLIVLSVRNHEIDGAKFLRKPIHTKTLKQALEFYYDELKRLRLDRLPSAAEVIPPPQPAPRAHHKTKQSLVGFASKSTRNALSNLENQTRVIHDCCGVANTIDLNTKRSSDKAKLYYDPSKHFLRILKTAVGRCRQEGQPIRLHLPGDKYIILLPKADLALTDLSDAKLRPRCLLEIKQNEIGIEPLHQGEAQLLNTTMQSSQPLNTLLWKVALWSSRGRLPVDTNINTLVNLRHWPNLTRLLAIPQFFRIAALWAKSSHSLANTQQILNIEARYICAFFSACLALDLLNIQSVATARPIRDAVTSKNPRAGLFRRILRHLRVA
jgi:hypothetical protein